MIEMVEFNALLTIKRVERVEFISVRHLHSALKSALSTVSIRSVSMPRLQSGFATPMLVSKIKSTDMPCVNVTSVAAGVLSVAGGLTSVAGGVTSVAGGVSSEIAGVASVATVIILVPDSMQ